MNRNDIISNHKELLLQMRVIEVDVERSLKEKNNDWRLLEEGRNALNLQMEVLIDQYWDWIKPVVLSQCPLCKEDFKCLFDPVDLNGFYWMDRTTRPRPQPSSCSHFILMKGALNLNDLPVNGGLFACKPGPDAPYVIPNILNVPGVQAVINPILMECGYTYYSTCYFSTEPKEISNKEIDLPFNDYNYDLQLWVQSGKLRVSDNSIMSMYAIKRPQLILGNQRSFF
jgi:hypothetical protein